MGDDNTDDEVLGMLRDAMGGGGDNEAEARAEQAIMRRVYMHIYPNSCAVGFLVGYTCKNKKCANPDSVPGAVPPATF